MRLIHDNIERVIECDMDGIVTERIDGYEIYEHFEKIKVIIYLTRDDGEIQKLVYNLKHGDLQQFCKLYVRYRDHVGRHKVLRDHVLEAAKCWNVKGYCQYYNDHLVDMAALRVSLPQFVQACCSERKKRDLPMSS